jgi:hypothetical protein
MLHTSENPCFPEEMADRAQLHKIGEFLKSEQLESDNYTIRKEVLLKTLPQMRDFCRLELQRFTQRLSTTARNHYQSIIEYLVDKEKNELAANNLSTTTDQYIIQSALYKFSVRWRKHFLDYLHPQFLSKHWNVLYNDSKPRDQRTF